jgi:hypothetical protein
MKNKLVLLGFLVLSASLLCLVLNGCGTKTEKTAEEQATEGQATPAAENEQAPQAAKTVAPAPAPPPPPREATIPAGTPITIVTSSTLSTKTNASGEAFAASLDGDLVDGDWTIAKKGALVTGVISDSDPGGRVKGVASITLTLKKMQLEDGRSVSIATNAFSKEAKSTKKKDAAKIGIGAGVGAAIGAIAGGGKGAAIGAGVGGGAGTAAALATRGDPAVVDAESRITFKLTAPLVVVEQK